MVRQLAAAAVVLAQARLASQLVDRAAAAAAAAAAGSGCSGRKRNRVAGVAEGGVVHHVPRAHVRAEALPGPREEEGAPAARRGLAQGRRAGRFERRRSARGRRRRP